MRLTWSRPRLFSYIVVVVSVVEAPVVVCGEHWMKREKKYFKKLHPISLDFLVHSLFRRSLRRMIEFLTFCSSIDNDTGAIPENEKKQLNSGKAWTWRTVKLTNRRSVVGVRLDLVSRVDDVGWTIGPRVLLFYRIVNLRLAAVLTGHVLRLEEKIHALICASWIQQIRIKQTTPEVLIPSQNLPSLAWVFVVVCWWKLE